MTFNGIGIDRLIRGKLFQDRVADEGSAGHCRREIKRRLRPASADLDNRAGRPSAFARLQDFGQPCDRRMQEERCKGQMPAARLFDFRDQTDCQKRIASEVEEAVVNARLARHPAHRTKCGPAFPPSRFEAQRTAARIRDGSAREMAARFGPFCHWVVGGVAPARQRLTGSCARAGFAPGASAAR